MLRRKKLAVQPIEAKDQVHYIGKTKISVETTSRYPADKRHFFDESSPQYQNDG